MNILKLFSDPIFRIKSAHIVVVIVLIINVSLFTQNIFSIIIQIILAIAVTLHHLDDENLKNNLLASQSELKEDKNIFDRNVIVSETDLDGKITYVNNNYLLACGYSRDELIGSTHAKVRGNDTSNKIYINLWYELKNGNVFSGVFKNKRKDDTPFWVDSHISPIITNNKKTGYKSIMFDITDKILAQKKLEHAIEDKELELKEQMNRFEFVINSSRDGFWDYDLIKKDFFLSDGWKKRLGFNENEELTYLDYLSLVPDENRFEHHKAMHDVIENYPNDLECVHFRIQYPLITKNTERLVIEDVGNIFFDKNKNPIRITGFHRDITDAERQAKIIESQNRVAAMGDMMANVAHQWRQPIGAINNALNDLEFDIELEDLTVVEAKVVLSTSKKVKEYTAYLNQTIDDFRQLTSDKKSKSKFLVLETLNKAQIIIADEYKKYNIDLNIIESGEGSSEAIGFNRELTQVIINILNNAKDILIEKEIQNPKVKCSVINLKKHIQIIVKDNAGGIPEDIMTKIFDPYFTTKHESLGTGIGLYMSKNIITNYFKGTFEVENENNGAKFTITIPRDVDNV